MKQPTLLKEVRCFVGIFYRNLYPNHAETLTLFKELIRHKRKFIWETHEQAFQKIKAIITQDTM